MKRKWKIATILSIATLTCSFGYLWGIPAVVNLPSRKTQIENIICKNSGYKISLGNPKLTMGSFPSVWIASDNISLLNNDNSKALSIDNPKLKLKLFPLLFKNIEIKELTATNEIANITYTKDGHFYLGEYKLPPETKSNKKFTLSKLNLDLGSYQIYLQDDKNKQKVSLIGEYFSQGEYIQNKHTKFATKNTLTIGKTSTNMFADVEVALPLNIISEDKLKINADIENFDISTISDYVATMSKGYVKNLNGIINLSAKTTPNSFNRKTINIDLNTRDLIIEGNDRPSSIYFKDNLNFHINFRTIDNGINFENTNIEAKNIHLSLNGKLYNLGKQTPSYDLTAEVKDTRSEDVIAIIPGDERLLPDFNLYKLKKYIFYSDVNGKLKFKGSGNKPNVNGKIHIADAYLIKTMRGAKENADINMEFIGQKMLLDVFVPAANNQHVTVKGRVKIDGSKYSELEVKSTDSVPLAPAQEILVPLHEILKFQLGPVPMMNIAGLGSIDIRSAGKKVDPHIFGKIIFKNAAASFNDIHNLKLYNASGEVVFNDILVNFKNYTGTINGQNVQIWGDCKVLDKLNVYVKSSNQDIPKLIKMVNSSPILIDIQKVLKPFTNPQGIADIYLHIYGDVKNAEEVVFGEDLFSRGTVTLHNAKTLMQDTFLPFTNIDGVVNFDQYDSDYDLTGKIRESKVHVIGTGSNSEIDLKAYSDKFALKDIFDLLHPQMLLPYKKEIGNIYTSFVGGYKGFAEAGNLDYNKVVVNGKFISNMNSNNAIKLDGGTFIMKNGVLTTSDLNGLFNNNPCKLSFSANNLDKEEFNIMGAKFNFKNFDISSMDMIKKQIKLPKEYEAQLKNMTDFHGLIDIAGNIQNNLINAKTDLKNISFVYKPINSTIKVLSGNAKIVNNNLYLDKINSQVNSMPMFVNGEIANILNPVPYLNLSTTTKLNQRFFDRAFNMNTVYPVKVKGDINLRANLTGPLNAFRAKSTLNIGENSSIYYMGATLAGAPTGTINAEGIVTNPVSVVSDAIVYPNKVKLNSLDYNQTITSQSKKKSLQKQLHASGEISLLKDNVLGFKDFHLKTEQPTDSKIFNILFKKPTIKQGVFSTDLTLNGTSNEPKALGYLNVQSIDIPLYDVTVQDVNLDFKNDYINILSRGVILTNDILVKSKIVNKPTLPVEIENLDIYTETLNMNVVANYFDDFDADYIRHKKTQSNDIASLPVDTVIIKNAQINADKILIKKAAATDFSANISVDKNSIIDIKNFNFDIANGNANGSISYDLNTYEGKGKMSIKDTDAEIIAENFFDMPGQMYGSVTGDMEMSCKGLSSVDCINTLSGKGSFEVTDGRMPKLGSLEYLLKAGNLLTGGVTGVSINGIIDLITPLKTGSFKSISGDIKVTNGIADDINIYSNGTDLNMYLTGSYNIATLVADMEIYGSLSKNFSTILGKIGNTSLNTLFNTIPGININEINPKSTSNINKIPNFNKNNVLRVFRAEVYGDINGTNYVKSFRWIKN